MPTMEIYQSYSKGLKIKICLNVDVPPSRSSVGRRERRTTTMCPASRTFSTDTIGTPQAAATSSQANQPCNCQFLG